MAKKNKAKDILIKLKIDRIKYNIVKDGKIVKNPINRNKAKEFRSKKAAQAYAKRLGEGYHIKKYRGSG
ncbi:MAG: hypothetical protein KKE93_04930 [Nanoarchaeota archaeon]|nr:hypothetical protein [Nanoarchaeota archaeon]